MSAPVVHVFGVAIRWSPTECVALCEREVPLAKAIPIERAREATCPDCRRLARVPDAP